VNWDHIETLATALLTFLTSVGGFLYLFRKVQAVHVLVNSNLTKVMDKLGIEQERSGQLTNTLTEAGVPVPDRTQNNNDSTSDTTASTYSGN
jgi:hypothetical protein